MCQLDFQAMGKSHNSYKVACFCWKDIIITSSIPHNHSYSFIFVQQKTYGLTSPELKNRSLCVDIIMVLRQWYQIYPTIISFSLMSNYLYVSQILPHLHYEWKALWKCILTLILVREVVQLLHQLCTITQTFLLELIHGTERNGMELWSKTPNSTLQVV